MRTAATRMSEDTMFSSDLLEAARAIGPRLSQYVSEDDINRRLSVEVLTTLREAGFYRLFMPQSLGGMECDPVTTARIVEEIARHNTSAAWSMMVANTSTWWSSRLSDTGIDEIYENGPATFIAGAFHPPMRATPVDRGYLINGRSPLASNVHEANWMFVTAFVTDQGEIRINNGVPEMIGVYMRPGDCQIIDTWHTLGMRATDSNDIAAENAFVPSHLAYPLTPVLKPNRHYGDTLYKMPAIAACIGSLIAPIALSVARNAITELKTLADKKVPFGSTVSIREKGTVQRKLGMAEASVQAAHAYLFEVLSECWKKTQAAEPFSLEERARLLLSVAHTNQLCLQAVELMYSAAGTNAIYTRNKLAAYSCDAQVIRHHGFANESRYETAAQVYLGLQPDLPVIMF